MAVIWMDDPSYYNTANAAVRYGGIATVTNGAGRFGGPCWGGGGGNSAITTPGFANNATVTVGISLFIVTSISLFTNFMILYDLGTDQVDLRLTAGGQIEATRNGTVLATSTNTLLPNIWYRIEWQVTISPTVGTVEVKVDGIDWIGPLTGLNTRNTTNSQVNSFSFVNNTSLKWNDLVITDSNSPNAGFLGDVRCYLRQPNANSSAAWTPTFASFLNSHNYQLGESFKDSNGNIERCTVSGISQSSGTPTWATTGGNTTVSGGATFTVVGTGSNPGATNWMAVNEPNLVVGGGETDGDSSYNVDSTPGDVDLFTLPNLPAGANNIIAINNVIYCRKDDAGTRTISNEMKSGTTTVNGANLGLSTSYQFNDFIENTDPNTSAAWTVAAANALLVGYKEIA